MVSDAKARSASPENEWPAVGNDETRGPSPVWEVPMFGNEAPGDPWPVRGLRPPAGVSSLPHSADRVVAWIGLHPDRKEQSKSASRRRRVPAAFPIGIGGSLTT